MNKTNLPPAQKLTISPLKFGTVVIKQEDIGNELDINQTLTNLEKAVKEGVFKKDEPASK